MALAPGLVLLSAPAVEPLALGETKLWLKESLPDNDELILDLIQSAREFVEDETGRQLLTATWQLTLVGFPPYMPIRYWRIPESIQFSGVATTDFLRLPKPPVQSVVSVTYVHPDTGISTTLAADQYLLDSSTEPARLQPAYGTIWPVTRLQSNAVQVTFKSGYGDDAGSVPSKARTAMKFITALWYDNRTGGKPQDIEAAQRLLRKLWPGTYA